jgi:CubicO group peptidase (beta-lactamase class C family)
MAPQILAVSVLLWVGCLSPDSFKLPYRGYTPAAGVEGWSVATPDEVGMNGPALEKAFRVVQPGPSDDDNFPTVISMLLARHGKLVGEIYPRDAADRDRPGCIWSTTKSFTSMAFGIAREQGFFTDLEEPISAIIPEAFEAQAVAADPRKRKITIAHALTMRTGFDYDNGAPHKNDGDFFAGRVAQTLPYLLSLPLVTEPGSTFDYKNSDPHLISAIIQKRTGLSLARFADLNFFALLGITNYRWDTYKDGVTYGGFGLWLTPRDMLKSGQVVLQKGLFEGRQVVPEDWLAAATVEQVRTDDARPYGYYWWIARQGFTATGHGGQYIYVMPDLDLVVVITSEPDTNDLGGSESLDNIEKIVKLVRESVVQ